MRIIDLFNKIVNGEEVPEIISYSNLIFKWTGLNYYCEKVDEFLDKHICIEDLEQKIEIIEPQEHKIPEKLTETTLYGVPILNKKKLSNITLTNKRDIVDIKDKINEILDYLKEIK